MRWIRPTGSEIETNDLPETVEACEKMGWKRADKPERKDEEPVKRRGRPPKHKG